jgi:thymidine kinase
MAIFATGPFFSGGIEVVCGPMFSGKTEELIRRVKRAQIAKLKVQIFKPSIDNRYSDKDVVSHSSHSIKAVPVKDPLEILNKLYDSTRVVAIDEIQFFDKSVVTIISKLARRGCRVICAGLDQDYKGQPFGVMPELLAIADSVDKVQAICTVCGAPATKTYRKDPEVTEQVLVGETDLYEARCRVHFDYFDEETEFVNYNKAAQDKAEASL